MKSEKQRQSTTNTTYKITRTTPTDSRVSRPSLPSRSELQIDPRRSRLCQRWSSLYLFRRTASTKDLGKLLSVSVDLTNLHSNNNSIKTSTTNNHNTGPSPPLREVGREVTRASD